MTDDWFRHEPLMMTDDECLATFRALIRGEFLMQPNRPIVMCQFCNQPIHPGDEHGIIGSTVTAPGGGVLKVGDVPVYCRVLSFCFSPQKLGVINSLR